MSKLTFLKKGHDSFEIILDEKTIFSVGDNYWTWDVSDAFKTLASALNLDYVYEEEKYEDTEVETIPTMFVGTDKLLNVETINITLDDGDEVILFKNYQDEVKNFNERVNTRVIEPNSSNQFVFQNISPLWHCISDLNLTFAPFETKNINHTKDIINLSTDLKKSLEYGMLVQSV